MAVRNEQGRQRATGDNGRIPGVVHGAIMQAWLPLLSVLVQPNAAKAFDARASTCSARTSVAPSFMAFSTLLADKRQ